MSPVRVDLKGGGGGRCELSPSAGEPENFDFEPPVLISIFLKGGGAGGGPREPGEVVVLEAEGPRLRLPRGEKEAERRGGRGGAIRDEDASPASARVASGSSASTFTSSMMMEGSKAISAEGKNLRGSFSAKEDTGCFLARPEAGVVVAARRSVGLLDDDDDDDADDADDDDDDDDDNDNDDNDNDDDKCLAEGGRLLREVSGGQEKP